MLLECYVTQDGNVPVREWLLGLSEQDRSRAMRYLDLLSLQGSAARSPLVVPVGHSLYELRWPVNGKVHHIEYLYVRSSPKFVLLRGYIT
jgi:hypothetical protein